MPKLLSQGQLPIRWDWLLFSLFQQQVRKDKHTLCSPKYSGRTLLPPSRWHCIPHRSCDIKTYSVRITQRSRNELCFITWTLQPEKSSTCRYLCNFMCSLVSTAYGLMVLFHLLSLGEQFEMERNSMVHLSLWGIKRAIVNGSQGTKVNYL